MISPKFTNRLIKSSSPYLLQHAHNPVDWYPWSEEAFERSRCENRPIFLSIGYSTCHWCHVMERESFEVERIAQVMNAHFISIKVDREERPDLDEIYMTAVQAMTGSGGWPLNVFLTPDLKPFFGGTYWPPEKKWGRPGFIDVLEAVANAYESRPAEIRETSDRIFELLRKSSQPPMERKDTLEFAPIEKAARQLWARFDDQWGGFAGEPKFPQPTALSLLLRHYARSGEQKSLKMVTVTLDRMAYGGLFDQLGGGFHRYSVDRAWLVPHFEKMLYDNAQLAGVYLDAFRVTGKPLYASIARSTLDYLLREMADPQGGFYSAQDADSEGEEGKFYVWTEQEIQEILPAADWELLRGYYGVTSQGNFEGKNILHVAKAPEEVAKGHSMELAALEERLDGMRKKIFLERDKRIPPGTDRKVLAGWNGLAISSLARGFQVLGDERYRKAAQGAADFILTAMRPSSGLRHAWEAGKSQIDAFLEDYAFLIEGLLDLYEADFDVRWVKEALSLADQMEEKFWDEAQGGFFFTPAGAADVIVRIKSANDSAVPSANATAAEGLLRLGALTENPRWRHLGEKTLQAFIGMAEKEPVAFARFLCALDFCLAAPMTVGILASLEDPSTRWILSALYGRYLPDKVMALYDPRWEARDVFDILPLLRDKTMKEGKPTVYVCDALGCRKPVTTPEELEKILSNRQ